jgi:hypothetical protein
VLFLGNSVGAGLGHQLLGSIVDDAELALLDVGGE